MRNWILASPWFAFASASIHVLFVLYIRYVRHELTWTGREFLWMSPLSYGIVYAAVGSLGGIAAFVYPRAGRPRVVLTALLSVFLLGAFLLLLPGIHFLAATALALGLAVQAVRRTRAVHARVLLLIRLAALPAVATGLLGAVEQGTRQWREDRVIEAQRPAAGSPNVVLIVLDAVRADNLSAYGYPESTSPVLERLARQGVVFERAFATAPWSLPSHAGILTGLLPGQLYADWKIPFRRRVPTLAGELRDRGWATAMFSANTGYVTWETGLGRGFEHVDDYALDLQELVWSNVFEQTLGAHASHARGAPWFLQIHERRSAQKVVARFLDWQRRIGGRPFFAFLNLLDAHEPPLDPGTLRPQFVRPGKSDEVAEYDAAIAAMDRQIGRLVDTLSHRGTLSRTLLIVTADHGQLFGEHGQKYHGTSLYRRVLQVPLVMRFPGRVPAGQHVRNVVSLRDLASTVLDVLAVDDPGIGGPPLSRFWSTPGTGEDITESVAVAQVSRLPRGSEGQASAGPLDAIVGNRWYYIEGPGRHRELFDYTTDTAEAVNLAADAAFRDTVTMLSRRLRRIAPHRAPLGRDAAMTVQDGARSPFPADPATALPAMRPPRPDRRSGGEVGG